MHWRPKRRVEESDEWTQWDVVLYWMGRLKPIWIALALLFVAIGFDFKTPAQHFQAIEDDQSRLHQTDLKLQHSMDSINAATHDEVLGVQQDHRELRNYIRALVVAQCLDRPRRDTQRMGLPCSKLLSQGGFDEH